MSLDEKLTRLIKNIKEISPLINPFKPSESNIALQTMIIESLTLNNEIGLKILNELSIIRINAERRVKWP